MRAGIKGAPAYDRDIIAKEIPVAMVYNAVSHAVMMASPCNLEDFALGFSLSEGIVQRPDELLAIKVKPQEEGIALR